MANSENTGLKRLINAARYSSQGLKAAYQHEAAFRQELLLLLISIPLAMWVAESAVEVILLVGSILLLLVVELLNSAIEATVDRFGGEHHELSGRAKDMGSAAVLVMSVTAAMVWLLLLVC